MSTHDTEKQTTLDQAVTGLCECAPQTSEVRAAADRVWRRLETSEDQPTAAPAVVESCADFVAMIFAYRQGTLPAARRELLEDHTASCVTCRRALTQWGQAPRVESRPTLSGWSDWRRWGLAAAAVLVIGVGLKLGVVDRLLGTAVATRVVAERVDGRLYRLHDGMLVPVAGKESVGGGEAFRSGSGSRAVLRLADGSRVELNEQSELTVEPRRNGLAVVLKRGDVIVEAAKQAAGRHLWIDAPDCQIAVKGTVFTVTAGPKGSRVSVLEGEVWVEQGATVTKLIPGGQTVTRANIAPVPVATEVAWSCDPERYTELLKVLGTVSTQMMASLESLPVRYDSRLVGLLPADTFVFAAVPNITSAVADAGLDLGRRIEENPKLKAWFDEQRLAHPDAPDVFEALTRFSALGSALGDEVVLSVSGALGQNDPTVLLLAEAHDEAAFKTAVRESLQRIASSGGNDVPVVLVEDPAAIPARTGKALYVMASNGLAVATDSPAEITRLAAIPAGGSTPPPTTALFTQIAHSYSDGLTWLFAADAARLTHATPAGAGADNQIAEDLGLTDIGIILVEHKRLATGSQLRAVLTFSRDRRGVPAWLGAPAPMGSLELVSPNAYAVWCSLVKDPKAIADEVLGVIARDDPQGFAKITAFEQQHGLSVRDDLAAPLGGEILIAVDGPVLPKPAWKLVVAVDDQARLQQSIEKLVTELSAMLAAEGKATLALASTVEDGVTIHTVTSSDGLIEVHYTFSDGYWIVTGQKAVLKDALATRRSGISLPTSAVFRSTLPIDSQQQYSGLGFVNASALAGAIASAMPSGASPNAPLGLGELKKALGEAPAMALCVTGERDRILITGTGIDLLNPGRALSVLSGLVPSAPPATRPAPEAAQQGAVI